MSDLPDRLTPQAAATSRADDDQNPIEQTAAADAQNAAAIAAQSSVPMTVRLYGIKDVTLPGYLLMWAAGVLFGLGLIALSFETLRPTTAIGELLASQVGREPWLQTVAVWSPTLLLAGIAFEVIEGLVVLFAFRRAANQRFTASKESI